MEEHDNPAVEKAPEPKVTIIESNGRIFEIVEHFSSEQTYSDIIKNAIRREFQGD